MHDYRLELLEFSSIVDDDVYANIVEESRDSIIDTSVSIESSDFDRCSEIDAKFTEPHDAVNADVVCVHGIAFVVIAKWIKIISVGFVWRTSKNIKWRWCQRSIPEVQRKENDRF